MKDFGKEKKKQLSSQDSYAQGQLDFQDVGMGSPQGKMSPHQRPDDSLPWRDSTSEAVLPLSTINVVAI